jgi:hypothetical protein
MPNRLHRLLIGFIITVIASSLGASPGPAASAHPNLPQGLLPAVRDTLGPQAAAALAAPTAQQARLNAADAEAGDWFGWSVALSGDTALIGAPYEDPDLGAGPINNAGSAYVFVRSGATWSQQAKLNAADAETGDWFGRSVALSGDTALIGAPNEDPDLGSGPLTNAGSAYVFVRSGATWSQQAKLNAADAEAGDRFGWSVALSGDTALVGAPHEDPDLGGGPISYAGSAYVFVRSGATWSQQAKLNAADAEAGDWFGEAVALSGDTALVGAGHEDRDLGVGPRTDTGSAYVFVRSGVAWSQQAKLNAADAFVRDFGISVALSGDTALVGAGEYGTWSLDISAAYVYARSGVAWSQQAKLNTADPLSFFGHSVALAGGYALIGAPWDYNAGSAYVFVEQTFPDVPANHWAWQYIEALVDAGLTAGYADGTYRPENPVTRAEMAVFLKKGIHGSAYTPPSPDGSHPFGDIAGHWAEAWIEELYDEGLTSGYPDGTYRPENSVTRAEMAVFLLKAKHGSGFIPPAPSDGSFSDVAGHWAEAWIEQLKAEGITSGYPDGTYRPQNPVTRAEMAVFLVNTFSLPLL